MVIKIYIEGGSKGDDSVFRKGWNAFFQKAGFKNRMPTCVRGKGRRDTYDSFVIALETRKKDELPILLVDSEGPLNPKHSRWEHLFNQEGDKWKKPQGATDDQVFLMVQLMETWFLADPQMLSSYFGQQFNAKHIRDWPSLENVPKQDVLNALTQATAQCDKKQYAKGKTSFEMLAKLSPKLVETACPNAARLLNFLRKA